ncbi:hypothetical protein TL16_g02701 [Triparma laevis f. inornata]|uniref:TauD/TfdA-like domain-containing protein n=1 Tax=Triparma laevis f. inornata TaxID=1714386 RepID=A0A9W7DWD6_9STRA|nr:hypothetical protein TL16_g02701 [Triparma laevis f. inornata]
MITAPEAMGHLPITLLRTLEFTIAEVIMAAFRPEEKEEVLKQVGDRKMGLSCPNVNLKKSAEWSEADAAEIKKQLHEHSGVLTFPNQSEDLSPQDHVNVGRIFGEVEIHTAVKGLPDLPEVMEIQRLPTAKVVFGEDYHSDHSFQECPASYSLLRATNEVSPYGTNNTQFANTIHAYEDLSPLMKKLVDNLVVSHSAKRAYGDADEDSEKGAHKGNSKFAMLETPGMEVSVFQAKQVTRTKYTGVTPQSTAHPF